jgi:predicted Zn-dependent peptidase
MAAGATEVTVANGIVPMETARLENGLLVTFSPDRTAPIVAVNLWYHVGSANEREGRTGFAHLFEHMLFQGSEHVAANEHFELIQRAGGTLNGSTWLDRTNYFETVPSHQLELALWLESDRMGRLLPAMTQAKLDTQRDVVKNERRWSMDNQPYGTWWERLPALCFPREHPFHHSLMGSMEDLSAASLDDVAEFFRTYYTPDNAVLTIAGDFDADEAMTFVERHFGWIPRGNGKPPLPPMDVPGTFGSSLREVVEDEVAVPRAFVAARTPAFGSAGYHAASMLAAALGAGRGSRLHETLVRQRQLASTATAFTFDLSKGSDLLVVDATARPGVPVEALEQGIADILDAFCADGPRPGERERVLAQTETDFVTMLQTAGERADQLSRVATYFGDPRMLNAQLPAYRALTDGDLAAMAASRFVPTNRASLVYVPKQ